MLQQVIVMNQSIKFSSAENQVLGLFWCFIVFFFFSVQPHSCFLYTAYLTLLALRLRLTLAFGFRTFSRYFFYSVAFLFLKAFFPKLYLLLWIMIDHKRFHKMLYSISSAFIVVTIFMLKVISFSHIWSPEE